MTTSECEALANRDKAATASFNVGAVLRYKVIPEFYLRVRDASWLRKYSTLAITPNVRIYNVPLDCFQVRTIWAKRTGYYLNDRDELRYIGDDPLRMAQAEMATVAGTPSAWYPVQRESTDLEAPDTWKAIKLDCPPAEALTLPYQYMPFLRFEDTTTAVDLAKYLPEPLHFGLVHWLRAEILADRFGEGERGARKEMEQALTFVQLAKDFRELGPQGTYVVTMD